MLHRINLFMDRLPRFLSSVVILCIVLYAVLTPNPPSTRLFMFPYADKVVHFLMFGGLSSTILWDYGRITGRWWPRPWFVTAIVCSVFGAFTEWFQEVENAGRVAEFADFMADMAGAFIVPLFFYKVISHHAGHRRVRLSDKDVRPGEPERLVYEGSFPEDERRDWDVVLSLCDRHDGRFRTTRVMLNGVFAGFFFWWDFDDFAYIEHFAITPKARNGGTGGRALDLFIKKLNGKGVVLEAEPEADGEMARRRIAFYRRHGFDTVDGYVYIQPPYSAGKNEIELTLMTAGCCPEAKTMANTLHSEVYGVINNKS